MKNRGFSYWTIVALMAFVALFLAGMMRVALEKEITPSEPEKSAIETSAVEETPEPTVEKTRPVLAQKAVFEKTAAAPATDPAVIAAVNAKLKEDGLPININGGRGGHAIVVK